MFDEGLAGSAASSVLVRMAVRGCSNPAGPLVYDWCMARTNVDIDEKACAEIMRRYQLATKREAINFALRTVAAERASVEEALALEGSGWEGDLDEMRANRIP